MNLSLGYVSGHCDFLYQSFAYCRALLCADCQLWQSQTELSALQHVLQWHWQWVACGERQAGHGERTHCSWLGGLWCCQLCCFAAVICWSCDDLSGEIETFWGPSCWPTALVLSPASPAVNDTRAQERSTLLTKHLAFFVPGISNTWFPSFKGWLMMTRSIFLRSIQGQDTSKSATSTSCFPPEMLSSWVAALPHGHTGASTLLPIALRSH